MIYLFIIRHRWGELLYLTWKYLKQIYGKKEVQAAEQMPIEYRKCICKHRIEWDSSLIDKLINLKQDEKKYLTTVNSVYGSYLKNIAKTTDIWQGGLSNIFSSNSLFFVNPLYFINHLERCGIFEYNPYTDLTYAGVKVKNTPGFAPYLGEGKGINGYSEMTWEFNGIATNNDDIITTVHAGIDFARPYNECNTIPIHSLIQGKVIVSDDQQNENFGKYIIVQSSINSNYYYIVAHLSRDKSCLSVGDDVFPGKTVGYLGNTGKQLTVYYTTDDGKVCQREKTTNIKDSDRKYGFGAHLHLQLMKLNEIADVYNEKTKNISNTNVNSWNPIDHTIPWDAKLKGTKKK